MNTLLEATNLLPWPRRKSNFDMAGKAIYAAVSRGHQDVVDLLQRHGADPNTRNDLGEALLHAALEEGHVKVAK